MDSWSIRERNCVLNGFLDYNWKKLFEIGLWSIREWNKKWWARDVWGKEAAWDRLLRSMETQGKMVCPWCLSRWRKASSLIFCECLFSFSAQSNEECEKGFLIFFFVVFCLLHQDADSGENTRRKSPLYAAPQVPREGKRPRNHILNSCLCEIKRLIFFPCDGSES